MLKKLNNDYWSLSKFAGWLQGTPNEDKPRTMKDWKAFHRDAKTKHPIRYWLANEALDHIQNSLWFVPNVIYSIKCYLNNRFVSKTHALIAHPHNLKRGQWHDMDSRIEYCLLDSLVDFVEIEEAWIWCLWDKEKRDKYHAPKRLGTWRCKEAGIENLRWQSELKYGENEGITPRNRKLYGKPTQQALEAKWIMSAYLWYTQIRPNRPDPYKVSGWSELWSHGEGDLLENSSPELEKKRNKSFKTIQKLEKKYRDEDTKWLKELIEHRGSLWT